MGSINTPDNGSGIGTNQNLSFQYKILKSQALQPANCAATQTRTSISNELYSTTLSCISPFISLVGALTAIPSNAPR